MRQCHIDTWNIQAIGGQDWEGNDNKTQTAFKEKNLETYPSLEKEIPM
jgi:hypothetical protein